jgi:hypothetical protein
MQKKAKSRNEATEEMPEYASGGARGSRGSQDGRDRLLAWELGADKAYL